MTDGTQKSSDTTLMTVLLCSFDDSIRGGESQLVDLYHAVDILRRESPEDFEALCRIPVTFQTIDLIRPEPCWYEAAKTHIEVDYFGNVSIRRIGNIYIGLYTKTCE